MTTIMYLVFDLITSLECSKTSWCILLINFFLYPLNFLSVALPFAKFLANSISNFFLHTKLVIKSNKRFTEKSFLLKSLFAYLQKTPLHQYFLTVTFKAGKSRNFYCKANFSIINICSLMIIYAHRVFFYYVK